MLANLRTRNPELTIVEASELGALGLGRHLTSFDVSHMPALLKSRIPKEGVLYEPTWTQLEKLDVCSEVGRSVFGGMPMQAGICSGQNSQLNALEFHKGSEVLVAGTPLVLLLDHVSRIQNGIYQPKGSLKACYVSAGEAVELFPGTLHFTPVQVEPTGFAAAILLPRETNTPLDKSSLTAQEPMLYARNKWLIAHPHSAEAAAGAFVGILGENVRLHY